MENNERIRRPTPRIHQLINSPPPKTHQLKNLNRYLLFYKAALIFTPF